LGGAAQRAGRLLRFSRAVLESDESERRDDVRVDDLAEDVGE
jgi:hypothetical protein